MKRYAKEIEIQTARLLEQCGQLTAPVNLEAIAEYLGAHVIHEEMEDDVSGFLLREKGICTIAINKNHHPNRQRFTLAHECGHLHLHAKQADGLWVDKTVFFRDSSNKGDHFSEVQANQFAAGLLMPQRLLKNEIGDKSSVSEVEVARLAFKFGVSERAMTVRLMSLGLLEPVAA